VIQGAGFWIRALARSIDLLVHYAAVFAALILVMLALVIYCDLAHKDFNQFIAKLGPFTFLSALMSVLGALTYHALSESIHGSSLGKLVCGLVVVTDRATPCRFGAAFGRSAAFYIDGLFFGGIAAMSMADSSRHQRLGDKWCHTVVARRSAVPPGALRGASRFILAFVLALAGDMALSGAGLVLKVFL